MQKGKVTNLELEMKNSLAIRKMKKLPLLTELSQEDRRGG